MPSSSGNTESGDMDTFRTTLKPGLFGAPTMRPTHEKPTISTNQSRPLYFKPVPHSKPPPTPSKASQRPTFKPPHSSSKPGTHLISNPSSLVTIENFLTRPTTPSSMLIPRTSSSPIYNGNISVVLSNTTNGWFRPSVHASTKRPQYPTKISTTRKPQTTHPSPPNAHGSTKRPQYTIKVSTTKNPQAIPSSINAYSSTKWPQYSTNTSSTRRPQTTQAVSANIHATTKQPHYPIKTSTSRRPQSTRRTTKYPYNRPSWKPRPPSSGASTTSKPHVFTFSNYYSTRPSVSKTTQSSVVTVPTSFQSTSPTSIPVSVNKPTTQKVSTTKRPAVASSARPSLSTTERVSIPSDVTTLQTFNVTMIPFFTTYRPVLPKPTAPSIFNWFTPSVTKAPVIRNATTVSPTVVSATPSIIKPPYGIKPTEKPTRAPLFTIKAANTTSTEERSTTPSSKSTTPFPVSPCGLQNPRPQKKVVGGKNSAFGSWPWQASVRRTSFFGFSSTHRCGGALISRQWVATAGHCVDDLLLSQIKIRVGEYDFASVQEPHAYVERGVKKKVVHPRYNFFTYENDLALVQLEEAIDSKQFPHISPICLPPMEENLVGKNATVTGWGRLSEGGILPSILQEVQVPIISNEKCKNMFLAAGRHEYIPDIFMCAGFEEGGRDSCQGDSGGPLQIQSDDGYWFLAGIISWGIGCAEPNMPGVCTRISKFKDWIVQQIV
ncbi:serine proteinase stubble [Nephila pilipes]|uniref:Serine proteinase stubble n=1 Tax=Nephila pilipes TaxID=299642 RepID=A0A8X6U2H6_NEPPI|nr:serine proteinase stubble [Nephila pilipes]